jgi:hypothetical protein
MSLLFRLLLKPGTAIAAYYWVLTFITAFVGDANLDRFQRWLWNTPQEQRQTPPAGPTLGPEVEPLFVFYQHQMDTLHEVNVLQRQVLASPALPDEGY